MCRSGYRQKQGDKRCVCGGGWLITCTLPDHISERHCSRPATCYCSDLCVLRLQNMDCCHPTFPFLHLPPSVPHSASLQHLQSNVSGGRATLPADWLWMDRRRSGSSLELLNAALLAVGSLLEKWLASGQRTPSKCSLLHYPPPQHTDLTVPAAR